MDTSSAAQEEEDKRRMRKIIFRQHLNIITLIKILIPFYIYFILVLSTNFVNIDLCHMTMLNILIAYLPT